MATIDVSGVPAKVTITNVSSRVKNVQLYKTNTTVVMQPGDILVLKFDFSSELTYFLSLEIYRTYCKQWSNYRSWIREIEFKVNTSLS